MRTPLRVPSAGIDGAVERLPTWLAKVVARRYSPEAAAEALRRRPVFRYQVLASYLGLAVAFCALEAQVDDTNFPSLVSWRYLGCAPLLLILGVRIYTLKVFARRRKVEVNWLVANIHCPRDNRPDLGVRWIARIGEVRVLRGTSIATLVVLVALVEGSALTRPGNPGALRNLFLAEAAGYFLMCILMCFGSLVLGRRIRQKVTERISRPAVAASPAPAAYRA